MNDTTREDHEIAGAPAEAQYCEPADNSGEGYIVAMDPHPVFQDDPDALPAVGVPAELAPLLERAFLFLEDGEWAKADEYCERVLDKAPRTALAYLGKFMAEKHVRTREALEDVPIDWEGDHNYSKAVRFAEPDMAELLKRYALTGRSAKRQRRIRRAVIAAVVTLTCLALLAGAAAAVWYGRILPQRTFEAELAALENAVVGETVTFGSWKNPTEWRVLTRTGDELLLLSKRAVAISRYNADSIDTTWEKSDIRAWLNGAYYESAFGKAEKALIRLTEPDNDSASSVYYNGGSFSIDDYTYDDYYNDYYNNDDDDGDGYEYLSYTVKQTEALTDRLFLLNTAEVNRHLKTAGEKRCLAPPTNEKTGEEPPEEYIGWWLRTQTSAGMPACYIDEDGDTQYDYYGEDPELGVRPAMWVDLGNRQ